MNEWNTFGNRRRILGRSVVVAVRSRGRLHDRVEPFIQFVFGLAGEIEHGSFNKSNKQSVNSSIRQSVYQSISLSSHPPSKQYINL